MLLQLETLVGGKDLFLQKKKKIISSSFRVMNVEYEKNALDVMLDKSKRGKRTENRMQIDKL